MRPIPVAAARRLTGLLFEPELPTVGTEGYIDIDAPQALLQAALAAAARVADGLHVTRGQLTVEAVLKRLEREINQGLRG